MLRRKSGSHSAFRRLTRYEYNYALQDLLGLPWDFAKDLPPEPHSEEGFENSAELLHLSVSQFETYHRLAREALARATVVGDRPRTLYWGISMQDAAEREWPKQAEQLRKSRKRLADDPAKLQAELTRLEGVFVALTARPITGSCPRAALPRRNGSTTERSTLSLRRTRGSRFLPRHDCVAILPAGRDQNLVLELGNQLPDEGTMRVTARVSRSDSDEPGFPSLQLCSVGKPAMKDVPCYQSARGHTRHGQSRQAPNRQWDVPLGEIYPRNTVRKTSPMGATPSPSEYIRIANSSASTMDIQIDYVTVEAPVCGMATRISPQIFFETEHVENELDDAREIVKGFMSASLATTPTKQEVDRKMDLFAAMRPQCESFEEAVIEVLATILSSPQFLYVANTRLEAPTRATSQPGRKRQRQRDIPTGDASFALPVVQSARCGVARVGKRAELADADVLACRWIEC